MPAAAAAKLYHPSQRVSNKICDEIKSIIPLSCQTDDTCLMIGCDLNILGFPLDVHINLDPCLGGNLGSVAVQFPPLNVDFNETVAMCQDNILPIPGLKWTIDGVGVDAQVSSHINGDVRKLSVDIAIDGCIDVSIGQICGRDVTSVLPFKVFSTPSIDLSGACGSTPVPAPKDCRTDALEACQTCTGSSLKVWCWKTGHCYEVGDPLDPCTGQECTSTSAHSTCGCSMCSNTTCSTPPDYTSMCKSCVGINHGALGSNWCWKDLSCHDVGSVFDPCNPSRCVKNTSSTKAKCACTSCDDGGCK